MVVGVGCLELLFFQITLVSVLQAHRNEISRLSKQIESLQSQNTICADSLSCVQRHWLLLIDELKRTFQRLEMSKSTVDHAPVSDTLKQLLQNQVENFSFFFFLHVL